MGTRKRFCRRFVKFVQSLGQFAIPEEDKSYTRAVVCSLGRALEKVEGRWLLCVDNADSADAAEILGEVAKLAGPNGWLVVTSRRGGRGLWPGMTENQVLRLELLSPEEAMAVLWRWGKGKPRN